MLINIIGNISTGKTTLIKLLIKEISAKVYSIDDYRRKYNKDGTMEGEWTAQELMANDVAKAEGIVITETTGVSQYYKYMLTKYPGRIVTVMLTSKKKYAWHQARLRKKYSLPPVPWQANIKKSMKNIDDLLMVVDRDFTYEMTEVKGEDILPILKSII